MAYNHGSYNTLEQKLILDLAELKRTGKPIYPHVLAKKYKTTSKDITANIRHIPGVYLVEKCIADRRGYRGSVWGFRD
jgi:hypothetical protein